MSPKEKGAEGKGQSQASGGPGSPHRGQEGGVRAGRGRIGPPGRNRAHGEQRLCYLIENQINSRGGKKGKEVPLSQLWEAEMMGAGCPKRWGTQRERELQNKTKKCNRVGRGGERERRGKRGPRAVGEGPSPQAGTPGANRRPWTLERRGDRGPGPGAPEEGALCLKGLPSWAGSPVFWSFVPGLKRSFMSPVRVCIFVGFKYSLIRCCLFTERKYAFYFILLCRFNLLPFVFNN